MPKVKASRDDILREEEIKRMLEKADSDMVKCLVALLWLFGKRISEILRLKRKNVRVDDGFLYILFLVQKKRGRGKKPIPERRLKKITLENPYVKYIVRYVESIRDPEAWLFPGMSRPHLVKVKRMFPDGTEKVYKYERKDVGRMSRVQAYRIIKKLNPNAWCHLFRESLATSMAEYGATEEELMAWFDWDKPETAHKYVKRGTKLIEKWSQRTW